MPDGNVTLYMRSESPIRLNVTGIALGSSNLTGLEPSLPIELAPGQSEALLRELHLVSRDGKLHADSLRKLKR